MKNNSGWIVIASRVGARVYSLNSSGHLVPIEKFENSLGRERNRTLMYDVPGRGRSKLRGSAPHLMTGEKDPHEDAADQFALKLSRYIEAAWKKKSFSRLQFVAEPRLLGKFKKRLDAAIGPNIEWTAKDLDKVPQGKWPQILGFKRNPDENAYIHANRTLTS